MKDRGFNQLGFLAPTRVEERWLGEAETERGAAPYECPLSGRFAATSWRGRETQILRSRQDSAPLCPAGHLPHEGGDRTVLQACLHQPHAA